MPTAALHLSWALLSQQGSGKVTTPPAHPTNGPALTFLQTIPPNGVSAKARAGSQGDVVPKGGASQDLEGPWSAWPTAAPALTWLRSGPCLPCLPSGTRSGESETRYWLMTDKVT